MKKDKFTLKKVVVEHVEQYNQLLKYVFQVRLVSGRRSRASAYESRSTSC